MHIRIGTRGSELALWQARWVAQRLKAGGVESDIVIIETKGDKILSKSLSKIGSKGVFTAELEEQLLSGDIDIAVHSAKDVPSELPAGLALIAFTEREEVHDVVVSYNKHTRLADFDASFLVGTSSTRRVAMLRHYLPNVRTADVRGNLQTRLKKMDKGDYDALILAYAGVKRLGYQNLIVEVLPPDQFTPAVGQGSLAIEAATHLPADKRDTLRALLNDSPTEYCLLAERAMLHTLQGGCSVPVFGLAHIHAKELSLEAGIISLDGKKLLREQQTAPLAEAETLGRQLAQTLLSQGADKILAEIKKKL